MANLDAHGRALRKGRYSESGRVYFITTACHRRARLFASHRFADIMMREFAWQASRPDIESLACVVMPDHVHWLVQLCRSPALSGVVRSLKGRSARRINLERNSRGPVWEHGFHDHALRSDEAVTDVARYLIRNPLRAGIVDELDEYPYWQSVWHCRG